MQLLTDWCPEGVCVYVLKRKVWQKYVFVSFLQIQNFFNIWVRRQKCETRQKHFHQSSLNAAVLTHDGGRVFCIKRRMFQLLLSASHYQKHNPTSCPQRNRIIPLKDIDFLTSPNWSASLSSVYIMLQKIAASAVLPPSTASIPLFAANCQFFMRFLFHKNHQSSFSLFDPFFMFLLKSYCGINVCMWIVNCTASLSPITTVNIYQLLNLIEIFFNWFVSHHETAL